MRLSTILVGLVLFVASPCLADNPRLPGEPDLSSVSTDAVIDQLVNMKSAAPGIDPFANMRGFILGTSGTFEGGMIGAPDPDVTAPMRELVRRGTSALPALLNHLDDSRPTAYTITGVDIEGGDNPSRQHVLNGKTPFAVEVLSGEYDARIRTTPRLQCDGDCSAQEKDFTGPYNVKVGDVCFMLVGQIVNRQLTAVRYAHAGVLVVNSPVQIPALVQKTRRDWSGLTPEAHEASLLTDLRSTSNDSDDADALSRLQFYFPNAYAALGNADAEKRARFEANENR